MKANAMTRREWIGQYVRERERERERERCRKRNMRIQRGKN